jgi:hypothetical protein
VCHWSSIDATTGDEVDPETCKRGADGFCQGDPDAAMVGQETMVVAFGWVVECLP